MTALATPLITTADKLPARPSSPPRLRSPRSHAPLRTVERTEHAQNLALPGTMECPECHKQFTRGAVVIDEQAPLREPLCGYTGPCHQVKIFCDHCDCIFLRLRTGNVPWRGEWIGEYGIIRDPRKINAFLTQHPEAKGVLQ